MSSRQKKQKKANEAKNQPQQIPKQQVSKQQTPEQQIPKQTLQSFTSAFVENVSHAAALLLIAGIASPISQLNLSPVFGSIPASLHHQRALTVTIIAASIARLALKGYVSPNFAKYITIVAFWAPVFQSLLFPYSAKLGIEYGPLIIETLTYFSVLFLSVYAAGELMGSISLQQSNASTLLVDFAMPTVSYFTITTVAKASSELIPSILGTTIYGTRVGLQLFIAIMSAIVTPSWTIFFALPAILHTLLMNPHLPSQHGFQLANSTLLSTQNFTLLDRHESLTGYISVIENYADLSYRLMRCDHSLLGGEWLVTPTAYKQGQTKRETVFTVFVMLEAVRLIEPPIAQEDTKSNPSSPESALVIGLGIGTAPNAFIAHGINTTIVELDPVVHEYATKYFDLSPNHTAVIDDAVTYVSEKSTTNPASFKYIIHDVFTGGAEPAALFTTEFMRGLFNLLTDDGAVAINYAGDLTLGSTNMVLQTIHSIFPACRIFRETPPRKDLKEGEADFINMIVFCVKKSHGNSKQAFKFRKATDDDFLGTLSRRHYLQPKEELEVPFTYVTPEGGREVWRLDADELDKFHKESAVGHWKVMRTVLPDGVWEMW